MISEAGVAKRLTAVRGQPVESSQGFGALTKRKKVEQPKFAEYTISGLDPGTYYYFKAAARNAVGLGPWSAVSEKAGTLADVPASIPENPGIELIRTGCTTLTFGWQRTVDCRGAPVTHYVVRYAEDRETLYTDNANQFEIEETKFVTWPGMVILPPTPPEVCTAELHDRATMMVFVEYVMIRFGGLQQAWDWLDVNGKDDISAGEFLDGDVESGPPFSDFDQKDILHSVWKFLDSEEKGTISMNEFNKLRPYMQEAVAGNAGIAYDGVYCLLPNLLPATNYCIMVRSKSEGGLSDWVDCAAGPHKTLCMTPMAMDPLVGARDKRTSSSITFTWTLPWDSGSPLILLKLRWVIQDPDEAIVDRRKLAEGSQI
jgi:hypothetical protein